MWRNERIYKTEEQGDERANETTPQQAVQLINASADD